jgi:hypothetical protein
MSNFRHGTVTGPGLRPENGDAVQREKRSNEKNRKVWCAMEMMSSRLCNWQYPTELVAWRDSEDPRKCLLPPGTQRSTRVGEKRRMG